MTGRQTQSIVAPPSEAALVQAHANRRPALEVVVHPRRDQQAKRTAPVLLSGEPGLSLQANSPPAPPRLTNHATPLAR